MNLLLENSKNAKKSVPDSGTGVSPVSATQNTPSIANPAVTSAAPATSSSSTTFSSVSATPTSSSPSPPPLDLDRCQYGYTVASQRLWHRSIISVAQTTPVYSILFYILLPLFSMASLLTGCSLGEDSSSKFATDSEEQTIIGVAHNWHRGAMVHGISFPDMKEWSKDVLGKNVKVTGKVERILDESLFMIASSGGHAKFLPGAKFQVLPPVEIKSLSQINEETLGLNVIAEGMAVDMQDRKAILLADGILHIDTNEQWNEARTGCIVRVSGVLSKMVPLVAEDSRDVVIPQEDVKTPFLLKRSMWTGDSISQLQETVVESHALHSVQDVENYIGKPVRVLGAVRMDAGLLGIVFREKFFHVPELRQSGERFLGKEMEVYGDLKKNNGAYSIRFPKFLDVHSSRIMEMDYLEWFETGGKSRIRFSGKAKMHEKKAIVQFHDGYIQLEDVERWPDTYLAAQRINVTGVFERKEGKKAVIKNSNFWVSEVKEIKSRQDIFDNLNNKKGVHLVAKLANEGDVGVLHCNGIVVYLGFSLHHCIRKWPQDGIGQKVGFTGILTARTNNDDPQKPFIALLYAVFDDVDLQASLKNSRDKEAEVEDNEPANPVQIETKLPQTPTN